MDWISLLDCLDCLVSIILDVIEFISSKKDNSLDFKTSKLNSKTINNEHIEYHYYYFHE